MGNFEASYPVLTKLPSALECVNRPLKEGERPKRKGQSTVFEATGKISPSVDVDALRAARVTVKVDGTCCYVSEDGVLCARRDIRKNGEAPPEAIQISDDGVCFIPLPYQQPVDATYKYHHAALANSEQAHSLDNEGQPIVITMKPGMTYELIGTKIQGDLYQCPADVKVEVQTTKKNELLPRHYLIEHGAFEISTFNMDDFLADPLTYARDFITGAGLEGIVFHCPGGKIYKINRGHIGVKVDGSLKLAC